MSENKHTVESNDAHTWHDAQVVCTTYIHTTVRADFVPETAVVPSGCTLREMVIARGADRVIIKFKEPYKTKYGNWQQDLAEHEVVRSGEAVSVRVEDGARGLHVAVFGQMREPAQASKPVPSDEDDAYFNSKEHFDILSRFLFALEAKMIAKDPLEPTDSDTVGEAARVIKMLAEKTKE